MPKSTRKPSKTKSSSKLILNGPRRSPSPLLSKEAEDIDVNGFEDIDAVDLTREEDDEPADFLVSWSVYLDKVHRTDRAKMINLTTFDHVTFLADERARLEEYTRAKGYRVKQQHVKASIECRGMRKQDIVLLDLNDEEGWASLESVLLAWHKDKKRSIKVKMDLRFARKTASRPVQEVVTDEDDLEVSEEEEVFSRKKKVSQLLSVERLY